jgi:hypothetical protein
MRLERQYLDRGLLPDAHPQFFAQVVASEAQANREGRYLVNIG